MPPNPYKPTLIAQVPLGQAQGWTNVDFSQIDVITKCNKIMVASTAYSLISGNASPASLQKLVQADRAALWWNPNLTATLLFASFDFDPSNPQRTPKFMICMGINSPVTGNISTHTTYVSIRAAVKAFAANNEKTARLYLWRQQQGPSLDPRDLSYPIFEYATTHETAAGEPPVGTSEQYNKKRWPTNITTWMLKLTTDR